MLGVNHYTFSRDSTNVTGAEIPTARSSQLSSSESSSGAPSKAPSLPPIHSLSRASIKAQTGRRDERDSSPDFTYVRITRPGYNRTRYPSNKQQLQLHSWSDIPRTSADDYSPSELSADDSKYNDAMKYIRQIQAEGSGRRRKIISASQLEDVPSVNNSARINPDDTREYAERTRVE